MTMGTRLPLQYRDGDPRRILLRVVDRIVRHDTLNFVVVIATGVQVSVEAREVAA